MSAFPNILFGPDNEVFNTYTDRRWPLGTQLLTADGRRFRFAWNGTSALVPGDVIQASVPVTNHILQTPTAAAVGAQSVTVALGATAVFADQYRDGVLAVELGTGFGFAYPIDRHNAVASSGSFVVPLKRGCTVQVAIPATANSVSLIANPYSQVIQAPSTATASLVGVAVSAIPASGASGATPQYGWIQTGGLATVTTSGTVVVADPVVAGGAAGAVTPMAAAYAAGKTTGGLVGVVQHVATTTNKSTVLLGGVIQP